MDMETFLREMAAFSDKIPEFPDEVFTRESFYQDHDCVVRAEVFDRYQRSITDISARRPPAHLARAVLDELTGRN